MSDALFVFGDPQEPSPRGDNPPFPMTDSQRKLIRAAFSRLGIADAKTQLSMVNDLIGVPIRRVTDLTAQSASTLLPLLAARADRNGRPSTGNAWADRPEDTWLDKL
ncbi:hypothetical protein [Mycetocola zhujimingii]|uniref:hypothetical protein n=1 Tax=Mycetocola zhujimingii TaxID=2079792 RepID=UPI0013C44941|nr:hypothetical protein [Mycetocola zhujimingii]